MCADTTELSYQTMMADPLIRLVMQSDGVTPAELAALLHEVAEARAEPPCPYLVPLPHPRLRAVPALA